METVKSVKNRINDRQPRVTYTRMRFVTRSTRFTIPVQRKMSPACPQIKLNLLQTMHLLSTFLRGFHQNRVPSNPPECTKGEQKTKNNCLKTVVLRDKLLGFFHYIWENWIECVPNGVNFYVIYLRERKKAGTTMGFTHLQVKLGIERRLTLLKTKCLNYMYLPSILYELCIVGIYK